MSAIGNAPFVRFLLGMGLAALFITLLMLYSL